MTTMQPLLVFPNPAPPELIQMLDLTGWSWRAVADDLGARRDEPDDGWGGAIVVADRNPEAAFALCRALRKNDRPLEPLLLLVSGAQLAELDLRDDLYDDFCLWPFQPREFEARLKHALWRSVRSARAWVLEHSGLVLNLGT